MKALLDRLRRHREARSLVRRAVPDDLWRLTLARLPFLARRSEDELRSLRRLVSLFLDSKEFMGAGGLVVDDAIAVSIAAQACLPVLKLGLAPYQGFVGIVVQADEVSAQRSVTDDDGIVHEYTEHLTGEAVAGGPVMLSWRDVELSGESAEWGYNVVIHEFAHVLDMADGQATGMPPLPSAAARRAWSDTMEHEFAAFCAAVDSGQETLLDPYGATAMPEFFAVAVESFFVTPNDTRAAHPALYRMFADYFQQDPARDECLTRLG